MLSFCLFVYLFFLRWTRLSEVVILSADDWVYIFLFVCCLDEASYTVCYGWLGDAESSGFICGNSHYLILPRVSSLVV